MDTINSHDSQYPDKWDKPIIIYGNENKNTVCSTYKGQEVDVITNNIKNDKDRFIPPLHIITRDSGYGSNSNYGYLDTTDPDSDPNVLDSYYYSSQRSNINKNLN